MHQAIDFKDAFGHNGEGYLRVPAPSRGVIVG